jgi:negative regulator of flagellin synthesis FlgM
MTTFESVGKASSEKDKAGTTAAPAAATSAVKLSPLSEKLKALSKDYAASTAFDEKRVEQLKLAIANGTFKVDAEAVADKMIAEAKQLGSTKPN